MNVSGFNRIRKSLQDAENRRIAHLNELAFRTRPTWDEIERGFRLGNEFREIHAAALDSFAAHPRRFPATMPTMLLQSALVLSQALHILDHLARSFHSRQ